jgi:hypothetical protein
VSARRCLLAMVPICVVVVLAGCGGSASSRAEAHLAVLANAACRNAEDMGDHFHLGTELAGVRALMHSDRKLPRVATLIGDLAARQREQVALRKLSGKAGNGAYFSRKEGKGANKGEGANAFSLLEESYRLEVKLQADLKALGLTSCLGPPPRKLIIG